MRSKKTPPKKAVKKTIAKKVTPKPPEKKLIDGLYSHKFNCRILPASGKGMESIMESKKLKSFNKAINIALLEHTTLQQQVKELENELYLERTKGASIATTIYEFKDVFDKLMGFKVEKKVVLKKECEECGDRDCELSEYKGKMFCPFCLEYEMN